MPRLPTSSGDRAMGGPSPRLQRPRIIPQEAPHVKQRSDLVNGDEHPRGGEPRCYGLALAHYPRRDTVLSVGPQVQAVRDLPNDERALGVVIAYQVNRVLGPETVAVIHEGLCTKEAEP